jgi:hypothetical protein
MKKELKEALRLINKVSNDPRLGPDQGDQLQKAKRELEKVAESGKVDKHKVFRAVSRIATVLQQIVKGDAD